MTGSLTSYAKSRILARYSEDTESGLFFGWHVGCAIGTPTNITSNEGFEESGGDRVTILNNLNSFPTISDRYKTNGVSLVLSVPPDRIERVNTIVLWDKAVNGNPWVWFPLATEGIVVSGSTVVIPASSLLWTITVEGMSDRTKSAILNYFWGGALLPEVRASGTLSYEVAGKEFKFDGSSWVHQDSIQLRVKLQGSNLLGFNLYFRAVERSIPTIGFTKEIVPGTNMTQPLDIDGIESVEALISINTTDIDGLDPSIPVVFKYHCWLADDKGRTYTIEQGAFALKTRF